MSGVDWSSGWVWVVDISDMDLNLYRGQSGRVIRRLVVFSDDFGRHPSSSQHLVRELLKVNRGCCGSGDCSDCETYRATWVNTVGTRTPELSKADFVRAVGKVRQWAGSGHPSRAGEVLTGFRGGGCGWPRDLLGYVQRVNPKMWPGFRRTWQRRVNAGSIAGAVQKSLGERVAGEQRIVITTLPITADLVGRLDVDRWIYYCVDDFSAWPGLDSAVMQSMEQELIGKVDDVVTVSQTLQERIAGMGRDSALLTHGIDRDHWETFSRERLVERGRLPGWWPQVSGPVALFWGLIDQRLDVDWCNALTDELGKRDGCLVLAGPEQNMDTTVRELKNTVLPGAIGYDDLPELAALADVLVMPYVDEAVTRAMQPLKLKEYLATDRPVVVRDLPATAGWSDCCDVMGDAGAFAKACLDRADSGLLPVQRQARQQRLAGEDWSDKALVLSRIWKGHENTDMRSAA